LKEIIAFAKDSNASFFHYVSTAYVAGRTSSVCPEAPVYADEFANIYEETKAQAEKEVAARCTMYRIPFTILRPSIVYGDSRSGRANRFNALYYHVKSLYYIREIYINDILKQGGRKSREWGIYLDEKGTLHLPLSIFLAQRGYVNLIPIDYFVSAVLSVLGKAEAGSVYHITSDAPRTTEELASYCESFLKIKGIEIVYGNSSNGALSNPAKALFNRFVEPYRPYLLRLQDQRWKKLRQMCSEG
jgi:nucleoside-diphosphate-sugar epimerase